MTGQDSAAAPGPEAGAPPLGGSSPRGRPALAIVAIVAFGALLWLAGAGRVDVHGSMEGSRALVPQQMLRTGDYVVPRRGAQVYLAKPPLFYWAVVATSLASGGRVTAWSVRAVAGLSLVGIVVLGWLAVRRLAGARAAFLGAAVAATTPIVLEARDSNLDTLLAFAVALTLVGAFFLTEGHGRARASALACGLGLGLGLLTKGPIVLLFLVPTVLLYAGFLRRGPIARSRRAFAPWLGAIAVSIWVVSLVAPILGRIAALGYLVPAIMTGVFVRQGAGTVGRRGPWLAAIAIALAVAVPWVVVVTQRLGVGAVLENLGREVWQERVTAVGSSNRGPPWTYAVEFTVSTLPWVAFAVIAFLPRATLPLDSPRGRWLLFLRCWLLGSFVLFTVVGESRRLRYLIPAFLPAALLAADVIARAWDRSLDEGLRRHVARATRTVVGALCLAPFGILLLTRHARVGLAWTAVPVSISVAGAVAALWLLRRGRTDVAPLAGAALSLLALAVHDDFGRSAAVNARTSSRPGCERVRSLVPPGEDLRLAGLPPSPAAFYLDAPPVEPVLADPALLASHDRLWVVVDSKDAPDLATPAGFERTEIDRVAVPGALLVLLRLDRAR